MPRCVFAALVLVLVAGTATATEYKPTDASSSYQLSLLETQVLGSFLQEMGLELDPTNRISPPPEPRPRPRPRPVPAPPDPTPAPPDADPTPAPPDNDPQPVPAPPDPQPEPTPAPPQPEPDDGADFFDDDAFFSDDDMGFDEFVENADAEFDNAVAAWDREFEEQLRRWEQGRERHAQRARDYQEKTLELGSGPESTPLLALRDATINAMQPGDYYVIPNAMSMSVKNQNPRGTCTAFAGVRGIETLLAQNGVKSDLSEQHYYAITKGCVDRPCSGSQGDSTFNGFEAVNRYRAGLLSETECPYVAKVDENDITLVRERSCGGRRGVVGSTKIFKTRSINSVLNAIRSNQPVVLGFYVDCVYQLARGVIKANDPEARAKAKRVGLSCSAGGHAMLGIGYMRLPPSMASEGRYCLIVANSWTPDWATGGYGCLTERYIQENEGPTHSVLQTVQLTDRGQSVLAGGQ